jgi:hypothetical protein
MLQHCSEKKRKAHGKYEITISQPFKNFSRFYARVKDDAQKHSRRIEESFFPNIERRVTQISICNSKIMRVYELHSDAGV